MPHSVQGDCAPVTIDVTQATGAYTHTSANAYMQSQGHMHSLHTTATSNMVFNKSAQHFQEHRTCTWSSADNNDQGPSLLMELVDHLVALGVFCAKAFALHDSKQYGLKVLLQEKTSQLSTVWCMA